MRSAVLTALIIATALFMENMDGTVISTSLPAIARDLHQDPIVLKLALTSYMLTLAVFIPGLRLGRRQVRRAHRVLLGDRRLHAGLDLVRRLEFAADADRARACSGARRRDDGAGRAARAAAQRLENPKWSMRSPI